MEAHLGKEGETRSTLSADLVAGLTAAIPSIPDAMASGVLAGVSPLYGQLRRTGMLADLGEGNVYLAARVLGESAQQAWADAHTWLSETEDRGEQKQ